MISFGPTEEQELVRDTLREFAAEAMRPHARAQDEASEPSEELLGQLHELGLASTAIPETYGGGGEARSPITNALVLEELGYGDASLAVAAMAPAGFANAVLDFGTDEQKRALLPAFCGASFHAASQRTVTKARESPRSGSASGRLSNAGSIGIRWYLTPKARASCSASELLISAV